MQFFLLLSLLASPALIVALKNSAQCPGGKGNTFVCAVIEPVSKDESFTKFDDITIAKTGQSDFFRTIESVGVLRGSLSKEINALNLNVTAWSWSQLLGRTLKTLKNAEGSITNLISVSNTTLRNLESSFKTVNTANEKTVADAAAEAIKGFPNTIYEKMINLQSDAFKLDMEKCRVGLSNQLETLQNSTQKVAQQSYGKVIDFVDQLGSCVQKGVDNRCTSQANGKLGPLNSITPVFKSSSTRFELIGKKDLAKDPCVVRALRSFQDGVRKVKNLAK